jgi:hypothetical protein
MMLRLEEDVLRGIDRDEIIELHRARVKDTKCGR